jgi:hypothetical protein
VTKNLEIQKGLAVSRANCAAKFRAAYPERVLLVAPVIENDGNF